MNQTEKSNAPIVHIIDAKTGYTTMTTETGKFIGCRNLNLADTEIAAVFKPRKIEIEFTEADKEALVQLLAGPKEPNDMFTFKIWDIKNAHYISNSARFDSARAPYDCFPEKSVKKIAGRLLGKGNYEIHRFRLIRDEK